MTPTIEFTNGEMSQEEINIYLKHLETENPGRQLTKVVFELDGDYVNVRYWLYNPPFDRIRRITGYLVGTTDRWNDAKRAELRDREKSNL